MTTHSDKIQRIAIGSIAVALTVMAIKYAAYALTGSVALLSDALESIVNLVTAIAALIAIRVGARPADKHHPFGHHKAEYFSAVLEGVLIVIAALMILREAYDAVLRPRVISEPLLGILVNLVATALNAGWASLLIGRGRAWRSPALAADGWHILADVATSVGVLAGLLLATATGWNLLDPLLAAAVALHILRAGFRLMRSSMSGLMDETAGVEVEREIRALITANGTGALQVHDIRTRAAGPATFVEFHLVVPGAMTVAESHTICDRIEQAIEASIPGSEVLIHVEPEHKAKAKGALGL
jgi:cation diffusion facilitator family transporter